MSKDMRKLEITFPEPIELTNDDQRVLDAVATEICRRYERAHPGRVMWPAGVGFKVLYMPMTKAEEAAGRHMEFADDTFAIDCCEREDYSWPCAKCGIEQGDHKTCITDPKAGECDFEPAKKDLGPEPERGLVPMHVYLSAVKGRRDMRQALRDARQRIKDLEAVKSSTAATL